jgi:hypothetical protein
MAMCKHERSREIGGTCAADYTGSREAALLLSNPGLHLLARHVNSSARELARSWQVDGAGLLLLLPRLLTLLVLQNTVHGRRDHAADAMTTQGRRPRLVRWTCKRDVTHRFLYCEQKMGCAQDFCTSKVADKLCQSPPEKRTSPGMGGSRSSRLAPCPFRYG